MPRILAVALSSALMEMRDVVAKRREHAGHQAIDTGDLSELLHGGDVDQSFGSELVFADHRAQTAAVDDLESRRR